MKLFLKYIFCALFPLLICTILLRFYCVSRETCSTNLAKILRIAKTASVAEITEQFSNFTVGSYEKLKRTSENLALNEQSGGGKDVDLVIAVINSGKRQYPSNVQWPQYYVSMTVAVTLDQIMNIKNNFLRPKLFICQVDSGESMVKIWKPFVDVILKSNYAYDKKVVNQFEQEKRDYTFCLNFARKHWPNSTAILLLEDDSIPAANFLHILTNIIHQLQLPFERYSTQTKKPAYIKLYHPTRLRKIPWIIHAFSIPFLIVFMIALILYKFSFGISAIFMVYLFVILLSSCFVLGHTGISDVVHKLRHWLYLNGPYMVMSESCCTQAVLFPTKTIPKVVQYFDSQVCSPKYAKDHVLDKLPYAIGLPAVMTYENYVQHVGQYSSVRPDKKIVVD